MKQKHFRKFAMVFLFAALLMNVLPDTAFADAVPYEDQEVFTGMQSGASIIETSSGTLLMVGQDKMATDTPTKILASFSSDGGYTWSTPTDLNLPRINDKYYRMPNLVKLSTGRILLILHRRAMQAGGVPAICHSDDNGQTWSTPRLIRNEPETATYVMNDRTLVLSNGRIVIPVNRCTTQGAGATVGSYYSDDNGATWSVSNFVAYEDEDWRGPQEPAIVELNNGRVLMVMRSGQGCLYQSISSDSGASWPTPTPMSLESPVAPVNIERAPDGQLLIAWNNTAPDEPGSLTPRHPLTCAVSRDEGQTWSNYCDIETSTYEFAYPSIWFTDEDVIFTYYTTQSGYPYYGTKKTIISQSIVLDGIIPEPSIALLDEVGKPEGLGHRRINCRNIAFGPAASGRR